MLFSLCILVSLLGWGPWESTGPEGGDVNAPVQSRTNASELWALSGASPTQVVHSTDAGLSWEVQSSFTSGTPYDLIVTADNNLVAVGSSRTWSSTDAGLSWTGHYQSNTYFQDAVSHPTAPGELYAAGYKYDSSWKFAVLHSVDNGATFDVTYLPITGTQTYGRCIDISQSDPSILLVGGYGYTTDASTYEPALFRSIDGGASFTNVTPAAASSGYYFYGAAIHPANPDIMLSASLYKVYRSIDAGASWSEVQTQNYSYHMTYSMADNDLVYAGGSSRGYSSANGGLTWSNMTSGLTGSDIQWIVPSWDNSSDIFTSSSDGFFRSTNGGTTWTSSNNGLVAGKVLAMEESQGWIFMNLEDMGMYKSPASGTVSWEEVTTPLACGDFCDISADGSGTILALEGSG